MGEVIIICSGKGGVGKTMVSANLGATLAKMGKKVLLIDMDMGLRNLDIYLGLENKVVYDIADVLMGTCRLKQAIIKDKRFYQLFFIGSPQFKDTSEITEKDIHKLYDIVRKEYDYVIVDSPSGVGENALLSISGVDKAIIVTTMEYAALRDADMMDKVLTKHGIKLRKLIVNRVRPEFVGNRLFPSIAEINDTLKTEIIGIIQEDENIIMTTNNGMPVVLKDGSYIEENFKTIAQRI